MAALIGTRMASGAGGSIINISSVGAVMPDPDALPYSAAKAGLNAMTVGMARSFAPSVRVNCIQPGYFLTDISKAWGDPEEVARQTERLIPLRRAGDPSEIVGAALYLASSAASYTTGTILSVDGGLANDLAGGRTGVSVRPRRTQLVGVGARGGRDLLAAGRQCHG